MLHAHRLLPFRPIITPSLLVPQPPSRSCPPPQSVQTFGPQLAAQISEPLQFVDYLREPKRDEVRPMRQGDMPRGQVPVWLCIPAAATGRHHRELSKG